MRANPETMRSGFAQFACQPFGEFRPGCGGIARAHNGDQWLFQNGVFAADCQ